MSHSYSRSVLEETPGRALAYLRGVGTSGVIRSVLAQNGYTAEEHETGWRLLLKASGFQGDPVSIAPDGDAAVQGAIAELDGWDEPGFRRIQAALGRLHPKVAEFVFGGGLKAQVGSAAVVSVATMLDRLDALEGAAERKATRKEDHAALATLETRGITKAMRSHLGGLVKVAQKGTAPAKAPAGPSSAERAQQEALVELRRWYDDWADTARSLLTRRDHRIRLGLAKRKARGGKEQPPADAGAAGTLRNSA